MSDSWLSTLCSYTLCPASNPGRCLLGLLFLTLHLLLPSSFCFQAYAYSCISRTHPRCYSLLKGGACRVSFPSELQCL